MDKKKIETVKAKVDTSFRFKSYSVDEIMAAAGVDAFVEKLGKSNSWATLMEALSKLPEDAFLTDEEAEAALKMLRENK